MNDKSASEQFQELHNAWVNLWTVVAKEFPFFGRLFKLLLVDMWEAETPDIAPPPPPRGY